MFEICYKSKIFLFNVEIKTSQQLTPSTIKEYFTPVYITRTHNTFLFKLG